MPDRSLRRLFVRLTPRPGPVALLWVSAPVLIMLLVWQQASVDRLVVDLERTRDRHRSLESQVNALRLEANRLSSLGQVELRAEHELGLGNPATDQIVDLVFTEARNDRVFGFRSLVDEANAAPRRGGRPR